MGLIDQMKYVKILYLADVLEDIRNEMNRDYRCHSYAESINGIVKFLRPDGTTGNPFFGSCLVAWGDKCDRRLRQSKIEGKYVVLNK